MFGRKRKFARMSGFEFEEYVARVLRKNHYKKVQVTSKSNDQGVDVLAEKDGIRYAIQCKNYTGNVNNSAVQQAYTGSTFYGCDVPVVVTNSSFTESAKRLAEKTGVELWDGERLKELEGRSPVWWLFAYAPAIYLAFWRQELVAPYLIFGTVGLLCLFLFLKTLEKNRKKAVPARKEVPYFGKEGEEHIPVYLAAEADYEGICQQFFSEKEAEQLPDGELLAERIAEGAGRVLVCIREEAVCGFLAYSVHTPLFGNQKEIWVEECRALPGEEKKQLERALYLALYATARREAGGRVRFVNQKENRKNSLLRNTKQV